MASVKNNKAQGYQAEREIAAWIDENFPDELYMVRTGLDGGHDLTGRRAIGEVKRVKTGPAWLKEMLAQWGTDEDLMHLGFVKLAGGPGRNPRWLCVLDREELLGILERAYPVSTPAPTD